MNKQLNKSDLNMQRDSSLDRLDREEREERSKAADFFHDRRRASAVERRHRANNYYGSKDSGSMSDGEDLFPKLSANHHTEKEKKERKSTVTWRDRTTDEHPPRRTVAEEHCRSEVCGAPQRSEWWMREDERSHHLPKKGALTAKHKTEEKLTAVDRRTGVKESAKHKTEEVWRLSGSRHSKESVKDTQLDEMVRAHNEWAASKGFPLISRENVK